MSVNLLRQYKNLHNRQNYIIEKAEFYFNSGEYDNSIKLTEKIQATSPLFKTATLIKAKALWKSGNLSLALEQLNYLLVKEPTLIESYLLISKIYYQQKNFKNSKSVLLLAKEKILYCEVLCPELETLLIASELELNRSLELNNSDKKFRNFNQLTIFKELPIDCIYTVFSYLSLQDLCNSTLVCKQWTQDLSNLPQIWSNLNFNFEKKTRLIANNTVQTQIQSFFKRSGIRLKDLRISNLLISEATMFPMYFKGKVLQLSHLSLVGCELDSRLLDKIVVTLGATLRELDLSNLVGQSTPNLGLILKTCQSLKSLNLSNIPTFNDLLITDSLQTLHQSNNLPKLLNLKLRANSLTRGKFQQFINYFPQLTELDISYSKNLNIENLKNISKKLINLERIGVSGLYSMQDINLERYLLHLLSTLKNLVYLEFQNYPNLQDSLITLSVGFTNILVSLDFSHCRQITNSSLDAIGLGCPNLKTLKLANCPQITDIGIKSVLRYCPELQHLNLSFNPKLTDQFFEYLTQLPTGLEHLEAESCSELTTRGLIPYCKHRNSLKLRVLKLGTIGMLDVECYNWLKMRFSRVKFSINF